MISESASTGGKARGGEGASGEEGYSGWKGAAATGMRMQPGESAPGKSGRFRTLTHRVIHANQVMSKLRGLVQRRKRGLGNGSDGPGHMDVDEANGEGRASRELLGKLLSSPERAEAPSNGDPGDGVSVERMNSLAGLGHLDSSADFEFDERREATSAVPGASASATTSSSSGRRKKLTAHISQGQVPKWWAHMCRKSKNLSRAGSISSLDRAHSSGGESVHALRPSASLGSSFGTGRYFRSESGACLMSRRHTLRHLWRAYFTAFPREVRSKADKGSGCSSLRFEESFLSELLKEDVEITQPDRHVVGVQGALDVFRSYASLAGEEEPVKAEIVHLYIDQTDKCASFAEYVLQFPGETLVQSLRICELVKWDLELYRAEAGAEGEAEREERRKPGGGTAEAFYDAEAVEGAKGRPCLQSISYFGKAMKISPLAGQGMEVEGSEAEERGKEWRAGKGVAGEGERAPRTASARSFSRIVRNFADALDERDIPKLSGMLCKQFRMTAFDGVKSKDSFLLWLRALWSNKTFQREMSELYIDHVGRACFMKLHATCEVSSATVVNIVQWDISEEKISSLREYGEGFKILP